MSRYMLDMLARDERALFDSSCVITRPGTDEPVFDPNTGNYTHPDPATVYDGPCLARPLSQEMRQVESGGAAVTVHRYEVKVPRDTGVVEADIVTVTASAGDVGLVGVELTVRDVLLDEWQVNRRLICEDVRT